MKLGSGHKTPKPTIEVRAAPIVSADFKVGLKRSVTFYSSSFLTSFFYALAASNYGGLGFGHKSSPS